MADSCASEVPKVCLDRFSGAQTSSFPETKSVSMPLPSIDPHVELEQQFEDEFKKHLESVNKKRMLGFGALGAGFGGAVSFAASPVLVPGLAVAALAGGAGGYQWAKKKGGELIKRNRVAGSGCEGSSASKASQRPSLRRLRFLVKWGYWQLLEYESASSESRTALLSEVVRAFSPWVQRMFLVIKQGHVSGSNDTTETAKHLAPLYYWITRRAAVDAVLESAESVSVAVTRSAVGDCQIELCRVIFPTILETISFLERLGSAARVAAKLDGSNISSAKKRHTRNRLPRIVAALRGVLERSDVIGAMQSPTRHSAPETTSAFFPEVGDGAGSEAKANLEKLVVPPVGAEDEAGAMDQSADCDVMQEYHSCSDDSDEDGLPRAASTRRSNVQRADVTTSSEGHVTASFEQRSQAFPRGVGPHTWMPFDESFFDLRSASYLQDRKKEAAGRPLFELVHIDFLRVGADGVMSQATAHGDLGPAGLRQRGDNRFLFVQNWIFPPFQCVIIGAVDRSVLNSSGDDETPQIRAWKRFLELPTEEMKYAFKVIMSVEEGPWIVRRAVPKKPVLVGKQIKMKSFHSPGEYLELSFDVASGRAEQMAVSLVMRAMSSIQLAMLVLVEGRREDELPEAPLLCASLRGCDVTRFPCAQTA
eukprot:TRINITY_DN12670_c0_g1_i2.p1 TRINITY_DN12670_c0_g1~~TRINITY_DN12670_c0_g1_i2.p1  ORF type:complete len:649 (-),score=112.04 TRINITY_DN12670_c0_g1_i2:268-2214(-)